MAHIPRERNARTLGRRNAPIPSGRKHLYPLQGGPWLVERVFVPAASLTLAGLVLMVGIPFVYMELLKQPAHAFIIFLMVAGAMLTVIGPAAGFLGWLTNRAKQTCPECLRGMNRGAYVCPWCGFRDTPRVEEHA